MPGQGAERAVLAGEGEGRCFRELSVCLSCVPQCHIMSPVVAVSLPHLAHCLGHSSPGTMGRALPLLNIVPWTVQQGAGVKGSGSSLASALDFEGGLCTCGDSWCPLSDDVSRTGFGESLGPTLLTVLR